jgi:hypothetical protein
MAKRIKKAGPEPVVAVAEPVVVAPAGPLFLLDDGRDVAADDPAAHPRACEIDVLGVPYVHVAEDADGRWIYAHRDSRRR